jgi:hypothetical protein
MTASARLYDLNGWFEVKANPLSKVGVFPYLGKSIGPECEPNKIYMIYRPEEELANPACVESFRLVPFIDEHTMLGPEESGLFPAEEKGVHGVIGQETYFDGTTLFGNLRVFSNILAKKIESDKRELSCGYRCRYDMTPGTWNGQRYDGVQRDIRGNHLALVKEGRMGPEVAVLDHMKFTCDAKEKAMADKPDDDKEKGKDESGALTLEGVAKTLEQILPAIAAINETVGKLGGAPAVAAAAEGDEDPAKKATDEEDPNKKPVVDSDKPGAGMDAAAFTKLTATVDAQNKEIAALKANGPKTMFAEIANRNALASRLSTHVGAFDHAAMTTEDVAKYGVDKLQIKGVKPGTETIALDAWLSGREQSGAGDQIGVGMDAAPTSKGLDAFMQSVA